ncbi:MAG: asparagine synthase (glutamine-hydrolyzing) [Bacteroidia bacterium]|nr:asparagine synthase (glutamine-hydrolyzing) [Bacteroidia bacterium]MBP6657773.1 asparagine synthase (glutamine-hydrolyzing) [Bacteroidia bacterium]
MCGISGFIDSNLSNEQAEKTIGSMLESIAHRGPDARSTWINLPVVLGHNRLSIIDLSPDGVQPMHYFDSVIVFNGEIYNYIEVREELISKGYKFSTQSDTEVILAAYREYGTSCVDKFLGMWAFALWDKKKNELFCSRDRFGIKPFYYIFENGRFYFGSEYKALKKSPLFTNNLNLDQVSRGLQLGWVCYGEETYYTKLKSLPAACNLLYKQGDVEINRYWDIDATKKCTLSEEEKYNKFRELFLDSIRLHMRADVEIGGCLSGGLDSSAIAASVSKLFPEINFKTFTIYYEGKDSVDERPWVNEVLKENSSLKEFTYSPTDKDLIDNYERAFYHADVPLAGSSPISQYFVMQLAGKNKIRVLLDGQGSDEYLAGYMHSFYRLVGGLISKGNLLEAHKQFYAHASIQEFSGKKKLDSAAKSLLTVFQNENSLYNFEYRKYFPFLLKSTNSDLVLKDFNSSRLNQFLYHLTFNTSLPSLLQYEDRNSMAFSIESRVPFLDHRLVEFVFSLNDDDKFSQGITKKVLRNALKSILPSKIAGRMDKKGFVTPGEIKWLRGPLKNLTKIDLTKIDFIDENKARKVIKNFENGDNKNATLMWRICTLNHWLNN